MRQLSAHFFFLVKKQDRKEKRMAFPQLLKHICSISVRVPSLAIRTFDILNPSTSFCVKNMNFRHISITSLLNYPRPSRIERPKARSDYFRNAPIVEQGAEGEKYFQWVPEKRLKHEEFFPTIETHKELFNGVRYDQIPICYIRVSKNNTIMDFRKAESFEQICKTSMSMEGFKNAKKKTTVAGQATGVAGALRALRRGVTQCRVKIRGLGPGRMSSVKGLTLGGMTVISITDFTKLPEMGPRPKKQRRI